MDSALRRLIGPGAVAAALLIAGCSHDVMLRVTSVHNLNSPTKDRGHRLAYRLVQLKEMPPMAGVQFPSLWRHEKDVFPGLVLGEPEEGNLDPDTTVKLSVKRDKAATAFMLVGNYYKPQGSCWYYVQSFAQGSSVTLTAGPSCFSAKASK